MKLNKDIAGSVHVVLDIETLDTKPNAAIIALAAVVMTVEHGILNDDFYEIVDLDSSLKSGGTVDANTLKWWLTVPSESAKAEIIKQQGKPLAEVLTWFTKYMNRGKGLKVWGNGANFDNVIIRSSYDRLGMVCPWSSKQDMCFRTLKTFYPELIVKPPVDKQHIAIEDTRAQATSLLSMLRKMNDSGNV
jgi:DNA polymerase III epsilon subunit-like protein